MWLKKLFRGYPMTYSKEWFFDYWNWNPVDLYIDTLGRYWLATSRWDFRRERIKL